MLRGEPKFFLRPDEEVVAEARLRPVWILRSLLVALIVLGFLALLLWMLERVAAPDFPPWAWPAWAGFAAFLLITTGLAAWRRVVTTEYVVTNETVYVRRGRLLLSLESSPMDKITDITVFTTLLGRLLGYSNLVVRTAGGAPAFVGVQDAYALRSAVQDQRKGFIRRLLLEAGRHDEAVAVDEGPGQPAATERCRCPRCDHAFQVPALRPVDVTCPQCGTEGTLFEEVAA